MRDPCADGNVLCLDHININISIVIQYYHFARCYHWVKLGKGHGEIAQHYFFTIVCETSYFKIKKFNKEKAQQGFYFCRKFTHKDRNQGIIFEGDADLVYFM